LILAALMAGAAFVSGQETAGTGTNSPSGNASTNATPQTEKGKVIFKPPASIGTPHKRLTGASRGTADQAITLDVLVPVEIGLTTRETPSLFWFQSQAANANLELSLLEGKKTLHESADLKSAAGIQRFNAKDSNVKLSPNVPYKWVVALVLNEQDRSSDLVASGFIKRVPAPAELAAAVAKAGPAELPRLYAEAGFWYDAMESLADLIAANPGDKSLRQTRADLLTQVGLTNAAAHELKFAAGP
jgi:hypothetical protein